MSCLRGILETTPPPKNGFFKKKNLLGFELRTTRLRNTVQEMMTSRTTKTRKTTTDWPRVACFVNFLDAITHS